MNYPEKILELEVEISKLKTESDTSKKPKESDILPPHLKEFFENENNPTKKPF